MRSGYGTIWLTGHSASGKTTLARGLVAALQAAGVGAAHLLDGDTLRDGLARPLGHGLADRATMLRHIVETAAAHARAGRLPVVATISHQRWMRDLARDRLAPLFEVHVDCPPEICAGRDVKGHYARAHRGEYDCFIGVTHAYERSAEVDLRLDTGTEDAATALARLTAASLAFLGRPVAALQPVPPPASGAEALR